MKVGDIVKSTVTGQVGTITWMYDKNTAAVMCKDVRVVDDE